MSPAWHTTNLALWILAIILQAALAVSLFLKRIARAWPAFSVLILFYPLRAVLLFSLPGRLDAEAVTTWSGVLSVLALLLQAWFVLELILRLIRGSHSNKRRRGLIPAAIAVAALTCTWLTLSVVPGRLVVDRAQVLAWWVFLALFAAVMGQGTRGKNLVRISAGFAAFSFCQLIALAGRAHAFLARSPHAYVAWSYVPAGAYIFAVLYWLLFLSSDAAPEATAPKTFH